MLWRYTRTSLIVTAMLGIVVSPVYASSIEWAIMPGDVIKGHAELEEQCGKCHVRFDPGAQPKLCLDCHEDIAADVSKKEGYHGRLKDKNCRQCHTDHKGRDKDIVILDEKTFDHSQTDYLLFGKHEKTLCKDCHRDNIKYYKTPSSCFACHREDDEHKSAFGKKCKNCHQETDWKQLTFNHDVDTDYNLRGRHRSVGCTDCHSGPLYKEKTPSHCRDCHNEDDAHKKGLGLKCESCHTEKSWKDIIFDHQRDTRYPLRYKHASTKCGSCHKPYKFETKLSDDCYSCHRADDQKKGHKGRYGKKCKTCHNEKGFKPSTFRHDRDTKYPLRFKHKGVKCDSCHKGKSIYQEISATCFSCHENDDMKKGHKGRYGEKCENCHIEKSFKSIIFEHDRDTSYPLTGKHRKAKCDSCHKDSLSLKDNGTGCHSCHKKDDIHFGTYDLRCDKCHVTDDWRNVKKRNDSQ